MSDADASSSKGASAPSDVGEKFECNICFDQANEPVVSLCGHLYCWPCLDRWMQSQRLPSCPVCKAGIGKDKLIPIFTRGAERANPMHSSTPRPQAQRPDSTVRALLTRRSPCSPFPLAAQPERPAAESVPVLNRNVWLSRFFRSSLECAALLGGRCFFC